MTFLVAAGWAMTIGSLGILAALIGIRWREYRRSSRESRQDRELQGTWGEFSLARYAPMENLLSKDELEFLASQPGYRPEIGTKFKRDRKRIFRLYLRELSADFHRLHADARKAVSDAGPEHAELVGILLRQQAAFWLAIAGIELRLLLGPVTGGIDARGLIESIETMRIDLARFAVPAASIA